MNQPAFPENPYAAPLALVADEPVLEFEAAERGTRLAAVLLDGLFFGLSLVPVLVAAVFFADKGGASGSVGAGIAVMLGLLLPIGLLVWTCMLLARNGQTVAKKLLGIRVVRRDGSHCGLARIFFARYLPVSLMGAVPFVGGLVSLTDALLIFRDNRRCLHDEIADTIVVKA
jgi:uncharacterized RDD family membrane protein YckC